MLWYQLNEVVHEVKVIPTCNVIKYLFLQVIKVCEFYFSRYLLIFTLRVDSFYYPGGLIYYTPGGLLFRTVWGFSDNWHLCNFIAQGGKEHNSQNLGLSLALSGLRSTHVLTIAEFSEGMMEFYLISSIPAF